MLDAEAPHSQHSLPSALSTRARQRHSAPPSVTATSAHTLGHLHIRPRTPPETPVRLSPERAETRYGSSGGPPSTRPGWRLCCKFDATPGEASPEWRLITELAHQLHRAHLMVRISARCEPHSLILGSAQRTHNLCVCTCASLVGLARGLEPGHP